MLPSAKKKKQLLKWQITFSAHSFGSRWTLELRIVPVGSGATLQRVELNDGSFVGARGVKSTGEMTELWGYQRVNLPPFSLYFPVWIFLFLISRPPSAHPSPDSSSVCDNFSVSLPPRLALSSLSFFTPQCQQSLRLLSAKSRAEFP